MRPTDKIRQLLYKILTTMPNTKLMGDNLVRLLKVIRISIKLIIIY